MTDPQEMSEESVILRQLRKHCTCGYKGICQTCIYFIQKEIEEMARRENDSKKQRD